MKASRVQAFFDLAEKFNIELGFSPCPARIEITGTDITRMRELRSYLIRHLILIQEVAAKSGYNYDTDEYDKETRNIETEHEFDVWEVVIAPLDNEEERIRDYWLERQSMRFMDGLPDDFHSTWIDCAVNRPDVKDVNAYWGNYNYIVSAK